MWALILTVVTSAGAVSTSSVPGFESRTQCEGAGSQWVIDIAPMYRHTAYATCVLVRQGP